jgi:hypothetical protein
MTGLAGTLVNATVNNAKATRRLTLVSTHTRRPRPTAALERFSAPLSRNDLSL